MKRAVVGVCLAMIIVAGLSLVPGRAQEANAPAKGGGGAPPANPLKVALLKWYAANQVNTRFKVGNNPNDVAFDGQSIWVTNGGDGTVTKLRPSDGTVLGIFKVGALAYGIAFDGANIWVVNTGDNDVTKLRASDGKVLGTFGVGLRPWLAAFDGANIWVTNSGSGSISKLRASDGTTLGTFTLSGAGGIAFDGNYMWVSCEETGGRGNVTRLKLDGTIDGSFPVGPGPLGVAFDGANVWVAATAGNGGLTKLRAIDGKNLGTFPVGVSYLVAFDSVDIWVTTPAWVYVVRRSDGAVLSTLNGGASPFGIAFDGANIWVADTNGKSVSKL
jgi:hypothetical protein